MPTDVSRGSPAAIAITSLFWWTVLSPAGLLAVAVLCGRRPRLRGVLTVVILAPPVATLLPVAVMHGGWEALAAAAAVLAAGGAAVMAATSIVRARTRPERAERYATGALLFGAAGGMVGSAALVVAALFG